MSTGRTFLTSGAVSWQKLATYVVSGGASTTMPFDVSGLDLSPYSALQLRYAVQNATGSACNISLYFQGDSTAGNYDTQRFTANSTTLAGARGNDAVIFSMAASSHATGVIDIIADVAGDLRCTVFCDEGVTTAIILRLSVSAYRTNTAISALTTITPTSSVASTFANGSTIELWGYA